VMKIIAVIQCTKEDLYPYTTNPEDYCIGVCKRSRIFDAIILAVPDLKESRTFNTLASSWNVELVKGSVFNVAQRLLTAANRFDADVLVRLLLRRFYLDTELISEMISLLLSKRADYIRLPCDFNYELAGDVFTRDALNRTVEILKKGSDIENSACQFNPWYLMDKDKVNFKTLEHPGAQDYAPEKVCAIKEKLKQLICENQITYGWECPASAYAFVSQYIKSNETVLDIACGLGEGSRRLAETGARITGVDCNSQYIDRARSKFSGIPRIEFISSDATGFSQPETYDHIVSLHTLEHLSDPFSFLMLCRKNLKLEGRLFLEVPLLLPRPLGEPLNPFHCQEYSREELDKLMDKSGFKIDRRIGRNRGVYTDINSSREAVLYQCSKR